MSGASWSLTTTVLVLLGCAAVVVVAGYRLAKTADELADRTGMGEALAGALLLGGTTSLPGIATTLTGALEGDAQFTLANPVGGVAVQTVWIAIADLVYRRANLEHAAASLENVMQSLVLMAMLSVPVVAYATPGLELFGIHPVSLLIPVLYVYGLVLTRQLQKQPMWQPTQTEETREDEPEEPSDTPMRTLWTRMAALAVVVAATGYVIGQAGLGLIASTGLPSGFVGFTVTTAITSLPELVTLVAAVRLGALTLGVADIIGGNAFDVLLILLADVAYRPGGIYADAGPSVLLLTGATVLMTAALAGGLVLRSKKGIGFEGLAVPSIYLTTVALLFAVT